jgi:hypothetical protein
MRMAGVDLYPAEPRIHGPDVCKDAVEATPRINLVSSKPPNTSFEKAMRVFGFETCASYKSTLDKLKGDILSRIQPNVIQLPINRLKRKFLSSDIAPKTLPSNIKSAFYDSGPSPRSYKGDIIQYNTLASFTDPGPSSYIPTETSYPARGTRITFPDDTFSKMFPKGSILIKDFNGIINTGGPSLATLLFNIYQRDKPDIPTHRIVVEFMNSDNTDDSYTVTINEDKHPNLRCFHGNPTKNTFFNTKPVKGREQENILYGVLYIFCKEFCGDILIGLIAKHYDNERKKDPATLLPDYALVTGDGTLEAYASFLQINHIAKNHSRAGLEEAIVRIFAPPTQGQLKQIAKEEKEKVLDQIIRWNDSIYNACRHVSEGEVDITDIPNVPKVNTLIKDLFTNFYKYIVRIKTFLENEKVKLEANKDSVSNFMKHYKSYEVKNVFKRVTRDNVVLMRGIYDPFKYVPDNIDREAFPRIDREFLSFLRNIDKKVAKTKGGGRLEEDLGKGNARFQPPGANTDEYLNTYLKHPLSLINENPTLFLENIITRAIGELTLADDLRLVGPELIKVDVEDVYNFIFTIYDKECKISYNEDVIKSLILFLKNGHCGSHNEFNFYNEMLHKFSAEPPHAPNSRPTVMETYDWPFQPDVANAHGVQENVHGVQENANIPSTQEPILEMPETPRPVRVPVPLSKSYTTGKGVEISEQSRPTGKHSLGIGSKGGGGHHQSKKKTKYKNHTFTRKIYPNKRLRIKRRRTHKK